MGRVRKTDVGIASSSLTSVSRSSISCRPWHTEVFVHTGAVMTQFIQAGICQLCTVLGEYPACVSSLCLYCSLILSVGMNKKTTVPIFHILSRHSTMCEYLDDHMTKDSVI